MSIQRMHYGRYKKHYADCKTVKGSYDKNTKTVEVMIPDGRMKKSGVRGERYFVYDLYCINENGQYCRSLYKAVCEENAMKRHVKWCKEEGLIPCAEQPDRTVEKTYL